MEWQHIELSKFLNGKSEFTDAHDILIKAKEMEKERMIKFCIDWFISREMNIKEYYKQTFGGGEQ